MSRLMKTSVTADAIRNAIETRDGPALAGFYADNAVTRVIDRDNPPSRPREVRGKQAISAFWDDICGRAMVHQVDFSIAEGDKLAFTENCTYPDGAKVFCASALTLKQGLIAEQTIVQAWDE